MSKLLPLPVMKSATMKKAGLEVVAGRHFEGNPQSAEDSDGSGKALLHESSFPAQELKEAREVPANASDTPVLESYDCGT